MAPSKTGSKGPDLEETLRSYFLQAGYYVARGIPYRVEGEDITDIDLWLYERSVASTKRRLIVDIKNKKSPKASERIIWTKGLQSALGVDASIVATTDNRYSTKRLSKLLNVSLLDGEAVTKLQRSESFKSEDRYPAEYLDGAVKQIDTARRSSEWRGQLSDAKSALISGLGAQSSNKHLSIAGYFANQTLSAQPNSEQASVALRLFYLVSSYCAISLDFMLAEHVFKSLEDRRRSVVSSIRYGHSDATSSLYTVRIAVGLARRYAENGNAVAKQIEYGFQKDADAIPAEIIADYVSRTSTIEHLFNIARELERCSSAKIMRGYDELSLEAKSFLGIVLDFNQVSRERLAQAVSKSADAGLRKNIGLPESESTSLFPESGSSKTEEKKQA